MITETKVIYKCEYCNKLYQIKKWAIYHEQCCHKNPLNKRACLDCSSLGKKDITIYTGVGDEFGNESEGVRSLFYCNKKSQFMHLPKSEHKKNIFELGYETNHPMPLKCDDQEKTIDDLYLK